MAQQATDVGSETKSESTTTLDHAPDALPNYESDDRLDLEYENDTETVRVHRTWLLLGGIVREVDVESIYNYVEEQWEISHRHTRDYELMDDGETLAGDGSNWRGTGRNWREWAKERHLKRLDLRFPREDSHEPSADGTERTPIGESLE